MFTPKDMRGVYGVVNEGDVRSRSAFGGRWALGGILSVVSLREGRVSVVFGVGMPGIG